MLIFFRFQMAVLGRLAGATNAKLITCGVRISPRGTEVPDCAAQENALNASDREKAAKIRYQSFNVIGTVLRDVCDQSDQN